MRTVEANGTTIAFAQSGEGPPLLLLHGGEANHSMFDAFGALLAPHFTVIAYDQRDAGGTRNPPSPYGFEELADDAAALIAALGYRSTHVFGTSFGGAIAQVLAARHPDRVDRLVLSSTFRVGVARAQIDPNGFPRFADLRSRLPEALDGFAEYFFPRAHIAAHPEALDIFKSGDRSEEQRRRRGAVIDRPAKCDLTAIKAPTLVLVGTEDRLIPPTHTLALAKDIEGARTVVIAGVGHVGTIQAPAAVAAKVLAFLQAEPPKQQMMEGDDHERSRGGSDSRL
jgi:pimeloyl-ACP methyl ester carboxylesterase